MEMIGLDLRPCGLRLDQAAFGLSQGDAEILLPHAASSETSTPMSIILNCDTLPRAAIGLHFMQLRSCFLANRSLSWSARRFCASTFQLRQMSTCRSASDKLLLHTSCAPRPESRPLPRQARRGHLPGASCNRRDLISGGTCMASELSALGKQDRACSTSRRPAWSSRLAQTFGLADVLDRPGRVRRAASGPPALASACNTVMPGMCLKVPALRTAPRT